MSDLVISLDGASEALPPPVPTAIDLPQLDFDTEHRKLLSKLALFEDVAKCKDRLQSAAAELCNQRSSANELKLQIQLMDTEIFDLEAESKSIGTER